MKEITTVLIANRGEISRRITRTAHEMGLRTAAVYSDPDRAAPHVLEADLAVPLPGASATETYLDRQKLVEAAERVGADAVHPGYGFLSEDAAFAEACGDAGLVWVGPSPAVIRKMGSKIAAKAIAREAGVPVLPDAEAGDGTNGLEEAARSVGFPLLVKASAGGGGRGMRTVEKAADLQAAVESARREAESSFGDGTLFLERYLKAPRHVEVQVFGDEQGNVVHLFERECSIQRRHQKVIEESPSPSVSDDLRARMGEAAVALAREIGYTNAGTVEFLVEGEEFFFLEMNTRLQVEHPVTECVTGLDLVRMQLRVARGEPLALRQEDIRASGHAIEARLYAEDPADGFVPTFGPLWRFKPGATPGVRLDSGYEGGGEVPTHYDSMVAKAIVHATTRAESARRLARALREMEIHGPRTNRDFLAATLEHPDFLSGETRTDFVERHPGLVLAGPSETAEAVHTLACVAALAYRRRGTAPVLSFAPTGWRNVRSGGQRVVFERPGGEEIEVEYVLDAEGEPARLTATLAGRDYEAELLGLDEHGVRLVVGGVHHACRVRRAGDVVYVNSSAGQTELRELPRFVEPGAAAAARGPASEMPGAVLSVEVSAGDRVEEGQTLVVLEAMKMEHRVTAGGRAVVEEVLVEAGDTVDAHQLLVSLREVEDEGSNT